MKTLSISTAGLLLLQIVFILSVFLGSATALAQSPAPTNTNTSPAPTYNNPSPTPTYNNPSPAPGGSSGSRTIQNPLRVNSIAEFISALLRAVIAIGIPIAILFIVLAGFKFIAAQGSPDKLSEARTNFLYVVIGIAIFIGASALAELVMATLRQIGVNV